MHKLHFSPKFISYTPLLYDMSYDYILEYVTPQGIGVTPSWIQPPLSFYKFVLLILTWHLLVLVKGEFELEKERFGESIWRLREREKESWRSTIYIGEIKWFSVFINYFSQRSSLDLGELLHFPIVLYKSAE